MATFENSMRGIFGNLNPRRDPREQLIDAKVRGMLPPAMETATEVLGILSLLPQAFANAQRRELERLERSDPGGKESARVAAMQASIARADVLRATSAHGQARLDRLLATLDETGAQLFHGFVSDPSLQPLAGYRVELADPSSESRQALSATTARDGYFRIELRKRDVTNHAPVDWLGAVLGRVAGVKPHIRNGATKAEAAAAATGRVARVLVKDVNGAVVHEDPMPVSLDEGDVYREYAVGGPAKDDGSMPPRDDGPPGTGRPIPSAKDAAADASERARRESEAAERAAEVARREAAAKQEAEAARREAAAKREAALKREAEAKAEAAKAARPTANEAKPAAARAPSPAAGASPEKPAEPRPTPEGRAAAPQGTAKAEASAARLAATKKKSPSKRKAPTKRRGK